MQNAQAYLRLVAETGGFRDWVWAFVADGPRLPDHPLTVATMPAFTPEAKALSKALKKAGFTFVGPTICYAFMQSAGMVDDHMLGCFRYAGPT